MRKTPPPAPARASRAREVDNKRHQGVIAFRNRAPAEGHVGKERTPAPPR